MSSLMARSAWAWSLLLLITAVSAADDLERDAEEGVGGSEVPTVVDTAPAGVEYNPSLLDSTLRENGLVASIIRAEVENELKHARSKMSTDPAGLEVGLKLTLERVLKAPELNSELRAQLRNQLEVALREARRRGIEKDQRDIEVETARAAAEERQRLVQALDRDQERVKQLMDRFDSMMAAGQYDLAEETAASEVELIAPNLPEAVSSVVGSRLIRDAHLALVTRIARQKAVEDTLFQVEIALIPFPGDQPIVYPDAVDWERLSKMRKKWKDYASADLRDQEGPVHDIREKLKETTSFEFVETPLSDVVTYLGDNHHLDIKLDMKALEDMSIGPDQAVTYTVKGISLRSALRLMLGAMDLTYVIKDEVLLITTPEVADAELVTKVYPVGDLVIPIRSNMMMGGMMGGGMGGMMGGMGGGMMGGGMGGMGGMMGGGMGGMGGMMGGGMGGMGGGMGGMGGMF